MKMSLNNFLQMSVGIYKESYIKLYTRAVKMVNLQTQTSLTHHIIKISFISTERRSSDFLNGQAFMIVFSWKDFNLIKGNKY